MYHHKAGYLYILRPDHPSAMKSSGYVSCHRLALEQHLGKRIPKGFHIHHIDGNPRNNAIENLAVMSVSEHFLLHRKPDWQRLRDGWFKKNGKWMKPCRGCNRILPANSDNFYKLKSGHHEFMSRCRKCCRDTDIKNRQQRRKLEQCK